MAHPVLGFGGALPDLYPQGDDFCFTFYSTTRGDTPYSLANGATAIGPYYGSQVGPLSNAVALNCRIIYKLRPPSMSGWSPNATDFVWPSDQTVSNEVKAMVDLVKTNVNIAMWDVEPEELRPWRPAEMHYLELICSVVHSNDPLRRPVSMYEPNHRLASELAVSVQFQDLCAKGCYLNTVDPNYETNRIWARWSMEQTLGAIALGNTSAVPWIVLWMAADPPAGTFNLITNWCRHDAYMGLIMGGKGIHIWSGFRGRAGFSNASFQAYLDGYLTVARDLNGPLKLGSVFLRGQRQTNVTMTITAGPPVLQTIYRGATNIYPSLTYSSAMLNGTNYLFMVNSGSQPVTATFAQLPRTARTDLFTGTTTATTNGVFSLVVEGLDVKAFSQPPNRSPGFRSEVFPAPAGRVGADYQASVAGAAFDPDLASGDGLTFAKVSGPDWLNVAANGDLSGLPAAADAGANVFAVSVTDAAGLQAVGTISITVEPDAPPTLSLWSETAGNHLRLSWPPDYVTYFLEGQTNPAGAGLGPTWWPVGGVVSNQAALPLDPALGSVFFRLVRGN